MLKYINLFKRKLLSAYVVAWYYVSFTKLKLVSRILLHVCFRVRRVHKRNLRGIWKTKKHSHFFMLGNLVQGTRHCGGLWMLSVICWLTLAARWATPGPAASPAFAGSSAAASLFPRWAHVLLCVNGISFSCRSLASLRMEVVRDRCGLLFLLTLPCFLSSCPSQVLFQLTYCGFRPHIRGRQQVPLFYNTHHGSASLVDPWPIQPAYTRHCAGL